MAAGSQVESVFWDPALAADEEAMALVRRCRAKGASVDRLAPGVLERVADTVTPQPVVAVLPYVDVPLERLRGASMLVVCVGVRDPGNAGTVLRSAEASGAEGLISCEGSVDVYNPKTVRASAGSLFHVPVVVGGEAVAVLERIGGWGNRRLGAVTAEGTDYTHCDLTSPLALVLGNETSGLPMRVGPVLDGLVTIPMAGRTESLNVGMAASVLCFEAARQRRATATAPTAEAVR
jgi:TrmH family RNA methyltransferase